MRVLGLDPGLQTTGYAVLEVTEGRATICEAGVIRSSVERVAADMAPRLLVLYDALVEIITQWKPETIAVEQLYAHYDHPRTAILMEHARGCYFLAGAQAGVTVMSYPSTRVKKLVTGHGRATKEQMQYAIMRELNLGQLPEPHDVADALAVALCHAHMLGSIGNAASSSTGINTSALFDDD